MNRSFITVILFLLCGFSVAAQEGKNISLNEITWMLGKWERQNIKQGQSAFENWKKESDDRFSGTGISMKGTDTTFVEKLSIVIKEGGLFYVAEVSHNAEPTYFKITEISENGFVCENPQHDFPKKIEYKLETGEKLTAIISGDGKAIPFVYTKM